MNRGGQRQDPLEAFADIARALTESLEMSEVLRRIAAEAMALMRSDAVAIMLWDGEVARFVVNETGAGSRIPLGFEVRPDPQVVALLRTREEPLAIREVQTSDLIPREVKERISIRDVVLTPLRVGAAAIGVLNLAFHRLPDDWERDRPLLRALAGQAAVALRNAQLYDEARASAERLLQAEKLSALGRLVARVAHELDNPLTTTRLHAELLETETLPAPALEQVRAILRETEHATAIVRDLLLFARPAQLLELGPVALPDVLRDAVARYSRYATAMGATILVDLPTALPPARADRRGLWHVLSNLLKNALQAVELVDGERRVVVRARLEAGGGATAPVIVVEVEDTGPGIAREVRGQLFEPFLSTKAIGEGTGLGLAIAKEIVEAHGGRIEGESREDGGARFRFTLPAAVPEEAGAPGGLAAAGAPGGDGPGAGGDAPAAAEQGSAERPKDGALAARQDPGIETGADPARLPGSGTASPGARGDSPAAAAEAGTGAAAGPAGLRDGSAPEIVGPGPGADVPDRRTGAPTDEHGPGKPPGRTACPPRRAASDPIRVLVIDDEPGLQRAIRRVLEQSGCVVVSALTGEEGLVQARAADFDLVLCDVRMPGMDGRVLYARLLKEAADATGAVTFMTGDVLTEDTRAFLEETGRPVLVKPFGRAQLVEALAAARGRVAT